MQMTDLPTEAQKPNKKVTLLFHAWTDGHPFIVHATTGNPPVQPHGYNLPSGGWSAYPGNNGEAAHWLVYKPKGRRKAIGHNLENVKAIRPGWLSLEEMTR